MEAPAGTPCTPRRKMARQLTGKRDDTPLHSWARAGNLIGIRDLINDTPEEELEEVLIKQNSAGETALYVAAEYGYVDLVDELINYYDLAAAEIKARNGFDALHIAAKEGDLEVVKILMEAHPGLSMTVDSANTTALHTAATQGHVQLVNFLLEAESSLAAIARTNGKTALHSAARNGHVEVVKLLLSKDLGIATRIDKKGQTALHMAVKGQNLVVVDELIKGDSSLLNMVDSKGNTPLHIATRKGRIQIVKLLLEQKETDMKVVNKSKETALDTAEKTAQPDLATLLVEYGCVSAKTLNPNPGRELKQTVSEIKHEVHNQLEHTVQTRKRVQGIAKRLHKLQHEGLNNAINSTTVVAVLIATVAFAAIFQIPGQFWDNPEHVPDGQSLGEARIGKDPAFMVFFIFDSIALFISLAVVVVQTSLVVIESKAKKQMMAIINKLMWLACVLISVAYLALSFVVIGKNNKRLAISVSIIGTVIMATTLGVMIYWVIMHRIEAANRKSMKRNQLGASRSRTWSVSVASDMDINNDYKRMYAL